MFAADAGDPVVTRFLTWKAYSEIPPLEEYLQARAKDWERDNHRYGYLLCLRDTELPIGSIAVEFSGGKAMFGYVRG